MTSTPDTETPRAPAKPPWSERFKALLAEYGPVLIVVWLSVFGLVWAGFALAIKFGFGVEGDTGFWGVVGAAYVATQLAKPLRIGATLVITPAVATVLRRFRKPAAGEASRPAATGAASGPEPIAPSGTPLDETPSGQG